MRFNDILISISYYINKCLSLWFYIILKEIFDTYNFIVYKTNLQILSFNALEYLLNLSILLSRGKEINRDIHSSGEWNELINAFLGVELYNSLYSIQRYLINIIVQLKELKNFYYFIEL